MKISDAERVDENENFYRVIKLVYRVKFNFMFIGFIMYALSMKQIQRTSNNYFNDNLGRFKHMVITRFQKCVLTPPM